MTEKSTSPLRHMNGQTDSFVRRAIEKMSGNRSVTRMILVFIGAFALFAILKPKVFLGPINLQNIMVAAPEIGVLAIAMMLAMLAGGIDLSLVATANLSAITISTLFTSIAASNPGTAESIAFPLALLGIAVGVACGLLNGVLIGVVGITPILATLGMMQILNGVAVVWTGGTTLYGSPAALTALGKTAVGPVPVLFITFLVIAVCTAILINRTALGRMIEMQGANPTAARFSGIRSTRVLLGSYAIGGGLAGLAGVLFISRNPTASADYGASYVLLVIVIAVLGGTNPNGGFASVAGVVLATLTLQAVSSGFTALRLSSYQYAIAQGVILVVVMIIDAVSWPQFQRSRTTTANMASQQIDSTRME